MFSSYSLAEGPELSSLLEKASFQKISKPGTEKKKPYKKIKSSLSKIKGLLFGPDWDLLIVHLGHVWGLFGICSGPVGRGGRSAVVFVHYHSSLTNYLSLMSTL